MKCANGKATGVGINLTTRSRNVLIYFEGGGACWDALTCYKAQMASFVASGYGRTEFDKDIQRSMLPLMRAEPQNPFKDFSYVFVPYCTGDFHVGDNIVTHTVEGADAGGSVQTHFVGGRNVQAVLDRVVATFRDAEQVWIGGVSAGGYSVLANFWRFKAAFPNTLRGVINDSGPPIQPRDELWAAWKSAWNWQPPPGCSECDARLEAYLDHDHALSPNTRFGLFSYEDDPAIAGYFGITREQLVQAGAGQLPPGTRLGYSADEFAARLTDVEHHMDALGANNRYMIRPNSSAGLVQHLVLLDQRAVSPFAQAPSPDLWKWLQRMYTGGPEWVNVTP
ncbi:MAG TPA: pectin acetylesterase-family hydrolase [Polyangiaceae bacterium]|nr:pectin acetylesterase-family hydrolase [Polyangiaceae bacterium]